MSDTPKMPVVGDRYRRDNATVEITRLADGMVYWVVITNTERLERFATLEQFRVLEDNSLRWGADFEPLSQEKEGEK